MKKCLIMSNHTKYQFFPYNEVKEIPNAWLKKHIGKEITDAGEDEPVSFLDTISLVGYKYYKVYNCEKGILMYYNNEIGFRYHTGSYMYIRFLYHNDCEEYLKILLKSYKMELRQNFCVNKYNLNCGDVIEFTCNIPMDLSTEFYEDILGLPRGSTQLDYFNKNQAIKMDEEKQGETHFQVQTMIEDGGQILVLPAFIPDVTQFRLKGVPNAPYFSVGPQNMIIPEKYIRVKKNFENDEVII